MNVLVTGSGAREHALAWRIAKSPSVSRVFAAPGNPGIAAMGDVATNVSLNLSPEGYPEIVRFCRENDISLAVVGPENHLADGLADFLRAAGISVFGPGKHGTMLESSKKYAMEFMRRHGIPHPEFQSFDAVEDALDYVSKTSGPWVIKADGLALGKGVTITADREEAQRVVRDYMSHGVFGEAGRKIVVQEFLEGREVSAMAITDGDYMIALPLARDHKRVGEGDVGPMTGGMGAYSPVDLSRDGLDLEKRIREEILERTVAGLKADGVDFRGTLFAGLMVTKDGPKVLEFNVRFGDPETQCVLPRLEGDFARVLLACADRKLREYVSAPNPAGGDALRVSPNACATVVVASGGYPNAYRKGMPISGLDEGAGASQPGVTVFHAGTKMQEGVLVTSGGRVLSVTAVAPTVEEALSLSYARAASIKFEGAFYRRDIGK